MLKDSRCTTKVRLETAEMCVNQQQSDLRDVLSAAGTAGVAIHVAMMESDGNCIFRLWDPKESASDLGHNVPEVDEFGRSSSLAMQSVNTNETARRARAASREEKWTMSNANALRFFSDSVTLSKDSRDRAETRELGVARAARVIFDDVRDDLQTSEELWYTFNVWFKTYSEEFEATFTALSMPPLFEPYLRMGLLRWNPLQQNELQGGKDCTAGEIDALLASAFVTTAGENELGTSKVMGFIRATLVAECVIPRLKWHIADVWDPCSCMSKTYSLMSGIRATQTHVELLSSNSDWKKGTAINAQLDLIDTALNRVEHTLENLVIPVCARSAPSQKIVMTQVQQAIIDEPIRRALRLARSIVICLALIDGGSVPGTKQRHRAKTLIGRLASCMCCCTQHAPIHCNSVWHTSDVYSSMENNASAEEWGPFLKTSGLSSPSLSN